MNFKELQAVASIPVAGIKSISVKAREETEQHSAPNVEVHKTVDIPLMLVITHGDKEVHIQFD